MNYLKFLGYNNSFRLNAPPEIPKDLAPYFSPRLPHQTSYDSLVKPTASQKRKQFTRHLSHTDFSKKAVEPGEGSMHHSSSLQTLLKQEDNRGVPGHGLTQRLKNFRYTSHSLLSKKMTAFKSKLSDSDEGNVKALSIPELVEQKKKKPFKFMRASSDSSVMAELLVRSVMNVDNSLESILEVHDSSSPEANLEKEKIKLEPFLSVPQLSTDTHSTQSTSSESTSSDDDENFDSAGNNVEYDTVSNIVKNVKIIERKLSMRRSVSEELPFIKNNRFCFTRQEEISEDPFQNEAEESPAENEPLCEEICSPKLLAKEEICPQEEPFAQDLIAENESGESQDEPFKEDIPRFAEAEDFSVDHSDEEVHFFLSDPDDENILEDMLDKEQAGNSTLNLPVDTKKADSKLIIPPVMIGADIQSKSLVTTAMQTILLEKVNIMGTYTPPMSPASSDKTRKTFNLSPPESMRSSPSTTGKEESFLPHITKTFEALRKSPTTLSLAEVGSSKETESAPFMSLNNITCTKSEDVSNTDSKKSIAEEEIDKTRRLGQSDGDINTPLARTNSMGFLMQKKFNFLRFGKTRQTMAESGRRRSHEPLPSDNKEKSNKKSFRKKLFSFKRSKGLLDAALKNVAMETVQDILATSHGKKTANPTAPFLSSAILNSTNKINTSSQNIKSDSAPANTEIDKGSSVSNINMHASLTPDLRSAGSPATKQTDSGHQRTESMGTKMSFSPAKHTAVPNIHRRSSDSDLSITPKGKQSSAIEQSLGILTS